MTHGRGGFLFGVVLLWAAIAGAGACGGRPGPVAAGGAGGASGGGGGATTSSGTPGASGPDGASGGAGGGGGAGGSDAVAIVDVGLDTGAVDGGETPIQGDVAAAAPVCPVGNFEAPRPGAARTVCAGVTRYNWSEGPTWVASVGAFFFTNFPNRTYATGDILRYTPATDRCEIFIDGARCNGLAATADGNIVGACQGQRAVVKFDLTTKAATIVASMAGGMILGQPNDLVVGNDGSIYFTSPAVRPDRPAGLASAALRIDPAGTISVFVQGDSNGIALSPDQRRLYVVGQGVFDVDRLGVPSNRRPFALGGDGIAVDCAGNVYDNGGGITNPQGQRIGTFPGGTNMAFGGPDGKTLLVVTPQAVRVVPMNLPGLP